MTSTPAGRRSPRLLTMGVVMVIPTFLAMAVVVVAILTGHPQDWFIPTISALFILAVVGGILVNVERRRDRIRFHQFDCALRVVDGTCKGLTRRWRSGAAILERHEIRFRRALGGIRFLPAGRVDLVLVRVGPRRPPTGWRSAVTIQPGSGVVQAVTSGGATVEAAFPAPHTNWALEQLTAPEPR